MSDVNQLFSSSQLALGAYADLLTGLTSQAGNVGPLLRADMTPTQLEQFATLYPAVLDQYADSSGLSTVVFSDGNGNLTLAIRGTELETNDLRNDADIASAGAAYEQIVALVNWWQWASTPAGQPVKQYRLIRLPGGGAPAGSVL